MSARDILIVFVKRARAGEVKTRLLAAIGPEKAAAAYRALAEAEIARTVPRTGEYQRAFFYAPREAAAEVAAWLPGERLRPQQGSDLGQRMADAFAACFAEGARRVAIIGTDVPWVTRSGVVHALESLERTDVVIGPAEDGGYYLLALATPRPELFEGIAWSTPGVFQATLERAAALGLRVEALEPLLDVDTLDDLRRAVERLGASEAAEDHALAARLLALL